MYNISKITNREQQLTKNNYKKTFKKIIIKSMFYQQIRLKNKGGTSALGKKRLNSPLTIKKVKTQPQNTKP